MQSFLAMLLDDKYRRGAEKHGGNLLDLTPLELNTEALHECVDQLTYLLTQREKLIEFKNKYGAYTDDNKQLGAE